MCESVVSKTFLQNLELKVAQSKEPDIRFCLGLPGWYPCQFCSPVMDAMKSLKLKLKQDEENGNGPSLKAKKVDDRFSFDIEDSQIDLFKQGEIPANTAENTEWSYQIFESWRAAKNKGLTETEKCFDNVLRLKDQKVLCNWLCAGLGSNT